MGDITESHLVRNTIFYSKLYIFETHHYVIFFVRPRHSKPGMELLLIKYRPIIIVGLWCYNQSGVTELLIMRDHWVLIMVGSVLSQLNPSGFILYEVLVLWIIISWLCLKYIQIHVCMFNHFFICLLAS